MLKQRQFRLALKTLALICVSAAAYFVCVSTGSANSSAHWQESKPAKKELSQAELDFFEKKIRPVLADNCYGCHSAQAKKPKGGLMLDSRAGMLKGGASGQPAIVPGAVEKSLLIKAIRYSDAKLQMPIGGKLPEQV